MNASGSALLGLIEDLLGYARIEAGEEGVRPEIVLLTDLMNESVDLVRPLAEQKGLRLRMEGPTSPLELRELRLSGSSGRFSSTCWATRSSSPRPAM